MRVVVRQHEVFTKVKFCSLQDPEKCIETEALIDTGSTLSSVTEEAVKELGLQVVMSKPAESPLVSSPARVDVVNVLLELGGAKTATTVMVTRRYLVGLIDLEARGLVVDPATGRVTERPISV